MTGSDADHGVGVEADELTAAHSGAGEQFHDQPVARVLAGSGGEHELRGVGVVEELRQRLGPFGQIPVQDRVARRGIGPVPFDDPLEEHPQGAQPLPLGVLTQRPAAVARPGGEVDLEVLDRVAGDVGDRDDGGVGQQPAGEDPQRVVGDINAGRGEERRRLPQVAAHGLGQLRCGRGDLGPLDIRLAARRL